MTRTDKAGSQQWTAVPSLLGRTHQHCAAKICNSSPRANTHKLQNDPLTKSSVVLWFPTLGYFVTLVKSPVLRLNVLAGLVQPHLILSLSRHQTWHFLSLRAETRPVPARVSGSGASVTYPCYPAPMSLKKDETAAHCRPFELSYKLCIYSFSKATTDRHFEDWR